MRSLIARRRAPLQACREWTPLLVVLLIAMAGYYGAWIGHRSAGLVVAGVDLAEYVKFLPPVRAGQLHILRESFYAPLAACSLIASMVASRKVLPVWLRWWAGISAIPLALAMLPPAWSPGVLVLPEFRLQVIVMAACLVALPMFLLTAFLPDAIVLAIVGLLSLAAAVWPASSFLPLIEPMEELYRSALWPGWGCWASTLGFLSVAFLSIQAVFPRRPRRQRPG